MTELVAFACWLSALAVIIYAILLPEDFNQDIPLKIIE